MPRPVSGRVAPLLAAALATALVWVAPVSAVQPCPVDGIDSDGDGLTDDCELGLARRFAPALVVSSAACNWDPEAGRLGGAYFFGATPHRDRVRLAYLPAYYRDCGWAGPKCLFRLRGGCDPHAGDSEAIFIEVQRLSEPTDWRARRVFLSAHCFGRSDGDCRWFDAEELRWFGSTPVVWVAEGKNANYPSKSACDAGHRYFDTCDRNERTVRFPVASSARNIGSDARPFPAHADDPRCVAAVELGGTVPGSGVECLWDSDRFLGWAEGGEEGATGYRRYLIEVAGFAEASSTVSPAAALTPGPRFGHEMAFDEARGVTVLFGGFDPNGMPLGDTWLWDGSSWSRAAEHGPSARKWPAMAYDVRRRSVLLHGGREGAGRTGPSLGDTWLWDGVAWSEVPGPGPPPRDHHRAVYDRGRDRVVLFGGWNGERLRADTWEWDGATWSRRASEGPSARAPFGFAYDEGQRRALLVGGQDLDRAYDDAWAWNGDHWLRSEVGAPRPLGFHAMTYDPYARSILLFGGRDGDELFDELWVGDADGWTMAADDGPRSRGVYASAYDRQRRQLVIHGGGDLVEGAWRLDGRTWVWDAAGGWRVVAGGPSAHEGRATEPATTDLTPPARNQPAAAGGPAPEPVLLFGGSADGGPLGDTWLCGPGGWSAVPGTGPPARASHALAALGDGRFLLFGGWTGAERLDDTWLFAAGAWSRWPGAGPPARSAHALSFDASRGHVLLFGGSGLDGLMSDTWAWSADGWRRLDVEGPSARRNHAMAFDRGSGSIVLFGGGDRNGRLEDTWTWDGSSWTARDGSVPRRRDHHVMTHSPALDGVALFGGWDGEYLADLWLWRGGGWSVVDRMGPPRAGRPALVPTPSGLLLYGGMGTEGIAHGSWGFRDSTWAPASGCRS